MTTLWKTLSHNRLFQKCLSSNIIGTSIIIPNREKSRKQNVPKKRHPQWLPKQTRVLYDEHITSENKEFIQEVIQSKYIQPDLGYGMDSPLKMESSAVTSEWQPYIRRTGVIGKKIGIYPLWLKNGKKVTTTLLQIVDNHVIKYIPPEEFTPVKPGKHLHCKNKKASLIVGADSADPQLFTKEYCSLFNASGVMPKRVMHRFLISPEAALPPGTPLFAAHFRPGDVVDIRAKTVDRGFQGVMKRWGFKGMPATHGVTKTHRRPGNIGSGGTKARVMPGTKMPGHMGNRLRTIRGYKILRVNTKYNVIWVMGHNIPGETNNYCHIYDTLLPLRKHVKPPHFPTYLPGISPPVEEESYAEDVHTFREPTIEYKESSQQ